MKRLFLAVFIAALVFSFSGCDTPTSGSKTQYYYYEFFRISKSNYNSVALPSSATFSVIKNYRDKLKNYSVESIGSGTDATRQDIYDLLTSRGLSASQTNAEIELLNSVGNNAAAFEYALNSSYCVIAYVEKL
jgi:hypothetical protein